VATSGERLELVRSEISTSVTSGAGEGGNVAIDPRFVVLREGSRITADADQSDAGNILIVAETFLADDTSFVRASSNLGIDGVVEIDAPDQSTIQPAPALPADFLDAAALLRERCAARRASAGGSFVVAGRDGVPPSPDDYLPAPLTLEAATSVYAPVAAARLRDAETGETLGIALGCSS